MNLSPDARTIASDSGDLRLPPDRFYWALIEGALSTRKRRLSDRELRYLFEPLLPIPLDQVHAVFQRVDCGVVACGVQRQALEEPLARGIVTLGPQALPRFLIRSGASASRINLLTGPFAPAIVRGLRRGIAVRCMLAIVLAAVLVTIGLERRRSIHVSQSNAIAAATENIYDQILGADAMASAQPRAVQLVAALRRLQQTRNAHALPPDAAADVICDLESLLRAWPNACHIETEAITFTPSSITVRARIPREEVQTALEAFEPWDGWQRAQPEVSSQGDATVVTLRFGRPDRTRS